jgi:hypothetical protein
MSRDRRGDLAGVGALALIHLGWGVLLLQRAEYFCVNDCVTELLPRLTAVARSFQAGIVAFWDPNSFAGAKPFWMSGGGIYYPVLFPFYLAADTDDPAQAAVVLQLLPLVLHVAWASLGGYFFARCVLRLRVEGAIVAGLVFGFSPSLLMIDFVNQTQAYSYLPWITLAAVRALDTGSRRMWATGALLVGAACSAGNPDMVNRILVLVGLQIAVYWLSTRSRSDWTRSELMRLSSLLPMVLLGMATFAFGWAGYREGVAWAQETLRLSCEHVATFTHESSAPPASFLTLLYPSMFVDLLTLASFGGGILLLTAASCALVGFRWRSARGGESPWVAIASVVLGFSALVVLGYHTPVFGWLCWALPPFFGFPQPVYYALGISWALAILAGIGVSGIATGIPTRAVLLLCSWPALAAALTAASRPAIASFQWGNWLTTAMVYTIVAVVLLLAMTVLPPRCRRRVMVAAIVAEVLVSPVYLALSLPRDSELDMINRRTWVLSRSPAAELFPFMHRIAERDAVRFTGTRSFVDNQAWAVDGRALFGMSVKPVSPLIQRAFEPLAVNEPYELWLVELPPFLSNMNVGYLIADRGYPFAMASSATTSSDPGVRQLMGALRETAGGIEAAIAALPLVERTEHFDIRTLPAPLPFAYTQDRIFTATPEAQLDHVVNSDLRAAAFVSPEVGAAHDAILTRAAAPDQPPEGHFEALQSANVVSKVDRSNPNRKLIEVEMGRAALLVIAETWHHGWRARVDGKEAEVWKVNYLQQGVWMDAGAHQVELYFSPPGLRYGMVASAAAVLTIILAALYKRRRER